MEQLLGSSITYRIAVGPQQGRKVLFAAIPTDPGRKVSEINPGRFWDGRFVSVTD